MRFCFHSVRAPLAIPMAGWADDETYAAFRDILTVSPEWFYEWLPQAKEHWKDELVVTFDDAYRDAMVPALMATQRHKIRTIVFVPTAHIGKPFPRTPYDVMHGSELAYLAGLGVELGSHGHDHRDMRRLPRGLAESHLALSAEILTHLGSQPKVFAPPHGHLNRMLVEIANELPYPMALWGTNIDLAGKLPGSAARALADEHGYVDYDGHSHLWPWEE